MCGIAGYKGPLEATQVVIEGLRRLEYRGYDSWGVASINCDHIDLLRKEGKIGQVSISNFIRSSGISIGHTRWATHGGVCEDNAHPHLSYDKKIAVVHNGIVENYQALRESLQSKGIEFHSQTDTEVIPHLIALELQSSMAHHLNDLDADSQGLSFAEAVRRVCRQLQGSYAIVAVHQDFDEIVVARDGSPVVIGVRVDDADKEFFVASDVTAFLDHTKDVIYLQDGELAVVNTHIELMRLDSGSWVQPKIETIPWSLEEASKGQYHHFMLKEINEQPQVVSQALNQDPTQFQTALQLLTNSKRVILVGCGTSYHAALAGQSWFRSLSSLNTQTILASEFDSIAPLLTKDDLIIALSQSGETADVISAVKSAKDRNSKILCIVNVIGSTLARISDAVLLMRSGPEICVLATKSYLSELVILADLASNLGNRSKSEISKLSSMLRDVLRDDFGSQKTIEAIAPEVAHARDVLVIGRGPMFATALEAALKLKEASYVHAEGFAGGELKHGSIALVETGMPVIVFADNQTRQFTVSNAMEVRARGGWVIGVDSMPNPAYDVFIPVPDAGIFQPIVSIIPLQLLTYAVATLKGIDPDKPRNLAKSVTVK